MLRLQDNRHVTLAGYAVWTVVAALATMHCGGGGDDAQPEPPVDPDPGDEGPLGPSSFDLIDQALAEGRLDEETALTYQVLALVRHPALPAELLGHDLPGVDNVGVLLEVRLRGEAYFTPEHWALLEPIFRRPYDQGSYFYPGGPLPFAVRQAQPARPDCTVLQMLVTANNIFQVYYETDSQRAMAAAIVQALDSRIWPELTGLMGGELIGPNSAFDDSAQSPCGDPAKYDVFVSARGGDAAHEAWPESRRGTQAFTSYIIINADGVGGGPAHLAAHEVMHAFQWTYDVAAEWDDYRWLMEATATWVQWFIYPDESRAYRHNLARYFLNPRIWPTGGRSISSVGLQATDSEHEYGAYLWPYFHSQLAGAQVVRAIWENCRMFSSLFAVNIATPGGFAEQFRRFALFNYNREPVDTLPQSYARDALSYRVEEFIPEDFSAAGPGLAPVNLPDVTVAPLAAAYYRITPAPHARYMLFDLSVINAQPGAGLMAIVRKPGQAVGEIEDWTGLAQREFCRDRASQSADEIVLILANSNFATPTPLLGSDIQALITSSPCFASGTGAISQVMNSDRVSPNGYDHTTVEISVQFNFVYEPSVSLPGAWLFFFTEGGTMTYAYTYHSVTTQGDVVDDDVVPPCTFTPDTGQIELTYASAVTGVPRNWIAYWLSDPVDQTCPATYTSTSSSTGTSTYAYAHNPDSYASTDLYQDVNPDGLNSGGVFPDIFLHDLAGFQGSKRYVYNDGFYDVDTTYDVTCDLRLPAGQQLN